MFNGNFGTYGLTSWFNKLNFSQFFFSIYQCNKPITLQLLQLSRLFQFAVLIGVCCNFSKIFIFDLSLCYSSFNVVLLVPVIGIVRTSHIQSLGSVVVSPMLRSGFLTWARRRLAQRTSHFAYTWCRMSMNSLAVRHWKLVASAPTNTWSRTVVKTSSTFVCGSIPSMSSASTRCCHALELIGKF